ncbi:MAG: hypothetical protein ACKVTZ_04145, partial [Bacteroidia bacterium]
KRPISTFELLPSDVALGGTENVFTPVGKLSLGLGINGRLLLHRKVELNVKFLVLDKGYAEMHSTLPTTLNLDSEPTIKRKAIHLLYASFPFSLRYNWIAKEKWRIFSTLGLSQDINLINSNKLYDRFAMSWVSSTGVEIKISDFHNITIEPNIRVASQPYSTTAFSSENSRAYIYEPYSIGFMIGINRLTRSKTCPN